MNRILKGSAFLSFGLSIVTIGVSTVVGVLVYNI